MYHCVSYGFIRKIILNIDLLLKITPYASSNIPCWRFGFRLNSSRLLQQIGRIEQLSITSWLVEVSADIDMDSKQLITITTLITGLIKYCNFSMKNNREITCHKIWSRHMGFVAHNVNTGCYFATCALQFRIQFNNKLVFIFSHIVLIDILDFKNSIWRGPVVVVIVW